MRTGCRKLIYRIATINLIRSRCSSFILTGVDTTITTTTDEISLFRYSLMNYTLKPPSYHSIRGLCFALEGTCSCRTLLMIKTAHTWREIQMRLIALSHFASPPQHPGHPTGLRKKTMNKFELIHPNYKLISSERTLQSYESSSIIKRRAAKSISRSIRKIHLWVAKEKETLIAYN